MRSSRFSTSGRRIRQVVSNRWSRVGTRLTIAFLAVALLIPLVGLIAIRELHDLSLRAARLEAQHVAEQIAFTVAQGDEPTRPPLWNDPQVLQNYIVALHQQLGRDVEVVGLDRVIIADSIARNRGQVFAEDSGGEIAATMRDGIPRTFTERNADFPQGIDMIVVPLRSREGSTVGAVVLEYTPIYEELLAATAHWRDVIIGASLVGTAAGLTLGYVLARGIVRDLRKLARAADGVASGGNVTADVSARGEIGEVATSFNTMAERIAEQRRILVDMAITDPVTGLRNRRSFHYQLEQHLSHSRDSGTPLGMLMLDLDHFKSINDRHGHPAGDAALRAVARLIEDRLREGDVAARLGGEEFGVLLPGDDQRAAGSTAERLREAIAQRPVEYAGTAIAVTTSIGVVSSPEHGRTLEALIRRADDALYEAKRAGRNRACGPPDRE